MTRHSIAPMGLILSLGLFTFACGGPAPSSEPASHSNGSRRGTASSDDPDA